MKKHSHTRKIIRRKKNEKNEKNEKKNGGEDTRHWGTCVWHLFHTLTYSFDGKLQEHYHHFFEAVSYILPCQICIDHYKQMLDELPMVAQSFSPKIPETDVEKYCADKNGGKKIVEWMVGLHNRVNRRLHRKEYTVAEADVLYLGEKKVKHDLLVEFFQLIDFYILDDMSLVMFARVENIIENLVPIFPCLKCRDAMMSYQKQNGELSLGNRKKWIEDICQILRDC